MRKKWYLDYNLIVILLVLICFGLVMLYSSSYYNAQKDTGNDMYYLIRQAVFVGMGIAAMLGVSRIPYTLYKRFAVPIFAFSWLLMLLVLVPGIGHGAKGAKRWIDLGFTRFQPSEFTKIAIVIIIPLIIVRLGKKINSFKGIMMVMVPTAATCCIIFFANDHLSAAIIVFVMAYVMTAVSHRKTGRFAAVAVAVAAAAVAGALKLASVMESSGNFRLQRLLAWVNPEKYASADSYQIINGLYAIGSGGFFGKGMGNSSQKLGFIPESQNDMILAIICEELGVFGVIMLMLLFAALLYRLLVIARNAPDRYGCLMVVGIFTHIATQVILNACVILSIIPATGITLPFISYGGTALLLLMIEMGMALNVASVSSELKMKNRV